MSKPKKLGTDGLARWRPSSSSALASTAFQAGIGLFLVLALSQSGLDLVVANNIKVLVTLVVTLAALPVFILGGRVDWIPALVLAAGFAVGGLVGARFTVRGGDRIVRPVLVLSVLGFSGRLLGLY